MWGRKTASHSNLLHIHIFLLGSLWLCVLQHRLRGETLSVISCQVFARQLKLYLRSCAPSRLHSPNYSVYLHRYPVAKQLKHALKIWIQWRISSRADNFQLLVLRWCCLFGLNSPLGEPGRKWNLVSWQSANIQRHDLYSAAFGPCVTWGSAWITVSNRALIPVAIFNSFNTETLHGDISQTARVSVYLCLTARVYVCMPRVILRTLMMRMMVGLMGREAFKSISSNVIPMIDNNTMARSNWFHLDKKRNPKHLFITPHPLLCGSSCVK